MFEKWIVYAVAAAILWGASYAASGPILRAGMTPLVFYFYYSVVGAITATFLLFLRGKGNSIFLQLRGLETAHAFLLIFSLLAASLGALMTYLAVGAKNPTLASLIEISYPLFVVVFTWLFFRECQLNLMISLGAILVLCGVMLIVKYSS